jgi:hypothetical protein
MGGAFTEKMEWFKSNEKPEVVLLIADDPQKIKLLIAWTNTTVRQIENSATPPANVSENEIWQWLWEQVQFNPDELREKSAVPIQGFEKQLQFLIGNRLIYPDGTINSFVQRYLRDKVLKLFAAKPTASAKKKSA